MPWETFDAGWTERWSNRRLGRPSTVYEVAYENGETVLRATSNGSASLLWRPVRGNPTRHWRVRWRWKVARALAGDEPERDAAGDDYAARVFVVFDDETLRRETVALCYVWAARERSGSAFPSPYAPRVITVVLEQGDSLAGHWIFEERDVMADYAQLLGQQPRRITAIALMVDTDDTGAAATAWFDDIELTVAP